MSLFVSRLVHFTHEVMGPGHKKGEGSLRCQHSLRDEFL